LNDVLFVGGCMLADHKYTNINQNYRQTVGYLKADCNIIVDFYLGLVHILIYTLLLQ